MKGVQVFGYVSSRSHTVSAYCESGVKKFYENQCSHKGLENEMAKIDEWMHKKHIRTHGRIDRQVVGYGIKSLTKLQSFVFSFLSKQEMGSV